MRIYTLSSSESPEQVRYVGYTKHQLKKRLSEHKSDSKNLRTHKDKWMRKHLNNGNQIIITEIDSCEDVYELKKREKGYIALFKSMGAKLVNGSLGGDGVVGLRYSQEFKDWNREKKSIQVYCFDYATKEIVGIYKSITQMCRLVKLNKSRVGEILAGKSNVTRGYTVSYTSECPVPLKKKINVWNKGKNTIGFQVFTKTPIIIFNDKTSISFSRLKLAAEYFDVHHSQICRALNQKKKYRGYSFCRIDDKSNKS